MFHTKSQQSYKGMFQSFYLNGSLLELTFSFIVTTDLHYIMSHDEIKMAHTETSGSRQKESRHSIGHVRYCRMVMLRANLISTPEIV